MADEKPTFVQQDLPEELPAELAEETELDTALLDDAEREELARTENAADRRRIRAKGKKRADERKVREEVLHGLLSIPQGRQLIAWLVCDLTGVFGASINNDLNPNFLFHREGQRAVGLVLQAECLRADANNYTAAIRDHLQGATR